MDEFDGRVAVVTGAASGIGRAIAVRLAAEGMKVVVADIELEPAQMVVDELRSTGAEAIAAQVDVADYGSVEALADECHGRFGEVHLLCNNAGVLLFGGFRETTVADWQWLFGVNVMGVINGVHAFLPHMLATNSPAHIVNTTSVAALSGSGAYGSSKAAILSITESLHEELANTPVGVTALLPGMVESRILAAERNRQPRYGPATNTDPGTVGLDASHVADRLIEGLAVDELYVFAGIPQDFGDLHSTRRARTDALLAAIDAGIVAE